MKITLITLMNNPNNPKTSNPNLTTLLTNTTQSVRDGFPEENDPSKRSLESLVEEERGGGERREEKLGEGASKSESYSVGRAKRGEKVERELEGLVLKHWVSLCVFALEPVKVRYSSNKGLHPYALLTKLPPAYTFTRLLQFNALVTRTSTPAQTHLPPTLPPLPCRRNASYTRERHSS